MCATEIDHHDVRLHSFRERADSIFDPQRASPTDGRCEQRLLGGDQCIFPTISEFYYSVAEVEGPRALANAGASDTSLNLDDYILPKQQPQQKQP